MNSKDANRPRVLIIHEWFEAYGGAEAVVRTVSECFNDHVEVQVVGLWGNKQEHGLHRTSFMEKFTFLPKSIIAPFSFIAHQLWFGKYDLVVVSSHLFAHTARVWGSNSVPRVAYVHSPARYIWVPEIDDRLEQLLGARLSKFAVAALQQVDKRLHPAKQLLLANSSTVQSRIKNYWSRESYIVHPPVNTSFFNRYLNVDARSSAQRAVSAGRWVDYKHFDRAIRICAENRLHLRLLGGGPLELELRALATRLGANVDFVLRPTDANLAEEFAAADVFLFLGEEDFGITPVEALATGTPVLAINAGGAIDTIDSTVGALVDDLNSGPQVRAALEHCVSLDRGGIAERACKFDSAIFKRNFVHSVLEEYPATKRLFRTDLIS